MEPLVQPQNLVSTPQINQSTRPENLLGVFKTTSSAPTGTPKNWFDQIQIYQDVTGTILRLYWYDEVNAAWHYVTATA